jgi:amyloid beta A4 precursor protein-binding family B member 2
MAEYRLRDLRFLGIGKNNVKNCAFIMHEGNNKYIAHVFYCQPSGGQLCRAIEKARRLIYT